MSNQQFDYSIQNSEKQAASEQRRCIETITRTKNAIIKVRGTFGEHATKDEKTIIQDLILRHIDDFELDNTCKKSENVALTKEVAQCQ